MFARFDADMSIKRACCPLFTSPVGGNVKCKWEKAFNIYYSLVHINTVKHYVDYITHYRRHLFLWAGQNKGK